MTARKALVVGSNNHTSELPAVDALDGVVAYVEKATEPTAADYRRPIIEGDRWFNTATGFVYTYQDSVWLRDNVAALSGYVPFMLQNGASSPIALNDDGSVPFKLQDGTVSNIPTRA